MRLLERKNASEFSLTEDVVDYDEIPPYAILSHTWKEGEEVVFEELINGTSNGKPGYEKIRFCGEQAERNGLQYFWVDTCCINRSNNAELSEAINSMFRWYCSATRCYVYLSDVSSPALDTYDKLSELPFESAFRASRWFTRGWTLQELLAPNSVEFFSREGNRLGDKQSLQQQIHEITGIPIQALQRTSLSRFSVDERLSWAQNRQTTRKEDQAYALLGIFDVYMPLIYGEGRENALKRLLKEIYMPLQEPNRLPYAVGAPFNSLAKQHEPTCLPDTRIELLREIHGWADGHDECCIFWLNGLAGTGKSTISRTVARKWYNKGRLVASFFFSRGGGDVGHAGKFVTSIAVQLASSVPMIYRFICDAIVEHSDIASRSLRDQWQLLILDPLSKLDSNGYRTPYILVIDALDECDDDNNIQIILHLLAEARLLKTVRLRVFLTSRPEVPIRYGFYQMSETEHRDFILHNVSQSIVDHDIRIFLEYNLRLIGQDRSLEVGWPGAEVISHLAQSANGLFIWAATACRFLREGVKRQVIKNRLSCVLQSSGSVSEPEKHLSEIYITVLKSSIPATLTDKEIKGLYLQQKYILGSIVVLLSPLPTRSLNRLLSNEDLDETLEDLHAILDIPENKSRPLRLHHPSFRDFLLDKNRCRDPNFWVDEKQAHQTLVDRCIELMSISLKQDICSLGTPGMLVIDVDNSRVDYSLPPEIQYACLYWIQHLQEGGMQLRDNDRVHQFLREHFLHWLEALGWMGKVSEGIYAIASLESITMAGDCPQVAQFVHDSRRFVLYNRPAIEQAPLQTYCSALVFTPLMSIVRKQFKDCVTRWIQGLPKVENNWNAVLQTLEGHEGWVCAVAFSPDGKLLASASDDRTVKLWDAGSGAVLQTLEGHEGSVCAVAFSPDGKLLASASGDRTVKLWDAGSGAVLQTLEGHKGWVRAVAFSPDGKLLASASGDRTVKLWDAGSGAVLQTLEGHKGWVRAVAFSPDGKLLASASDDRTVKLWDAGSGAVLQTLEGHEDWVRAVAFSPDGKLLASASDDRTVKLWDAGSGAVLQTLEGHEGWVRAVAFSLDGKLLASASGDRTVKLWDAGSGAVLQTLEGHEDWVCAVAFSLDGKLLASASGDRTVKLWDAGSGAVLQTLEGHKDWVCAVAFSPDGKLLASASGDRTVKLWDAGSGAVLQTLEGHKDWVRAVAFSPDGKLLASASGDRTVKLWDAGSGAVLQTLEGHKDWVRAVAFSLDGKLLASASGDRTVKLWDAGSGAVLQTLEGHKDWVCAVAFSLDGKLLASASGDRTVKLWDAGSGAVLQTLEGHKDWVCAVAFSLDGKLLASASGDRTVKLWDAGSGAVLQTLEGHKDWVCAVAFSPDGKLLASASGDRTVKLWDAGSGAVQQTLDVDTAIRTLSFSDDMTFLRTDRGSLHTKILSNRATVSGLNIPYSVFVKEQWISRGGENILWLPSNYRSNHVAVHGSTIGLGYASGRVMFIELAF